MPITSHRRIEETLVDRLTGRRKQKITEHFGRFTDDGKNHQELRYLHEGMNHGGTVKKTVDRLTGQRTEKVTEHHGKSKDNGKNHQKLRYLIEGPMMHYGKVTTPCHYSKQQQKQDRGQLL